MPKVKKQGKHQVLRRSARIRARNAPENPPEAQKVEVSPVTVDQDADYDPYDSDATIVYSEDPIGYHEALQSASDIRVNESVTADVDYKIAVNTAIMAMVHEAALKAVKQLKLNE